jgi:hypothetical protein
MGASESEDGRFARLDGMKVETNVAFCKDEQTVCKENTALACSNFLPVWLVGGVDVRGGAAALSGRRLRVDTHDDDSAAGGGEGRSSNFYIDNS